MKLKWWGHAAFQITSEDGLKILTDPYDDQVGYKPIVEEVDLVTVSHDHFDHNAVDILPGNPEVFRKTGTFDYKGIKIKGVKSYHDKAGGQERGENIIFTVEVDGFRVCHLGDLGHLPDEALIKQIGDIDILLTPVGGTFTIDHEEAYQTTRILNPSIIVPMHFKTEVLTFDISGVERFTDHFPPEQVQVIGDSEINIKKLPDKQVICVLDYH